MGTTVERGNKHRAVVRMRGKTLTKTFDSKRDATAWIAATETNLRQAVTVLGFVNHLTLSEVLLKYKEEIVDKKPYKVRSQMARFARDHDGVELSQLTHEWWIKTIQGWRVQPTSAQRYVIAITSALHAAEDLKWNVKIDWTGYQEAMKAAKRQHLVDDSGRSRERRVSDEEIAVIKTAAAKFEFVAPISDIIDVAVLTTMRVGELCRITWRDLDQRRRMQKIRDRKHPTKKQGNDQTIPLLLPRGDYAGAPDPLAIMLRQPKTEARIFPYVPHNIGDIFTQACKAAGVDGACFHDLRHEGITRLFEQGFAIDEVALVSGHAKWETLRKYTHVKADSLHKGPRQMRAAA